MPLSNHERTTLPSTYTGQLLGIFVTSLQTIPANAYQ